MGVELSTHWPYGIETRTYRTVAWPECGKGHCPRVPRRSGKSERWPGPTNQRGHRAGGKPLSAASPGTWRRPVTDVGEARPRWSWRVRALGLSGCRWLASPECIAAMQHWLLEFAVHRVPEAVRAGFARPPKSFHGSAQSG